MLSFLMGQLKIIIPLSLNDFFHHSMLSIEYSMQFFTWILIPSALKDAQHVFNGQSDMALWERADRLGRAQDSISTFRAVYLCLIQCCPPLLVRCKCAVGILSRIQGAAAGTSMSSRYTTHTCAPGEQGDLTSG